MRGAKKSRHVFQVDDAFLAKRDDIITHLSIAAALSRPPLTAERLYTGRNSPDLPADSSLAPPALAMPPPGFQHRDEVSSMTTHDRPQPTRQFTPAEQRAIGEKLEKGLGPEYLSNRAAGGGQKVIYISGEKAINLANEVFGFNGWNTTIKDVMIDYVGTQ